MHFDQQLISSVLAKERPVKITGEHITGQGNQNIVHAPQLTFPRGSLEDDEPEEDMCAFLAGGGCAIPCV